MSETRYPAFRWFVILVVLWLTVSQGVLLIWPAPLMEHIARHYGLGLGATTGAIMLSFNIFVTVGAVLGGFCSDRFGWVPTLFAGTVLLAAASLVVPLFGHSFGPLILTRIVAGAAAGPTMAAIGTVAVQWFPREERGICLGLQGVGLTLGVALGFFFVPLAFIKTGSFLAAAAWMSIFPILGLALLVVVALGEKPPVAAAEELPGTPASFEHDFRQATRLPVFYFGLLCVFLECWVMQAFNDLTPVYLSAPAPLGAGHGVVLAGKFMGLVQLSIMIGSVASGFLLVKVFKGKNKALVGFGFFGAAVFALSVRFPFVAGNLRVLPVCLFLVGFFQGLIIPSTLAFISTNFPPHIVGKLTGLWMGLGILGGTVGIIVGASLLHHTGFYHASVVTVGIVALAGWLSSFLLSPPVALHAPAQGEAAFPPGRARAV